MALRWKRAHKVTTAVTSATRSAKVLCGHLQPPKIVPAPSATSSCGLRWSPLGNWLSKRSGVGWGGGSTSLPTHPPFESYTHQAVAAFKGLVPFDPLNAVCVCVSKGVGHKQTQASSRTCKEVHDGTQRHFMENDGASNTS